MMSMSQSQIDSENIKDMLNNIKEPHNHRAFEYLFDMYNRQFDTIIGLKNKVSELEDIVKKSKPGPKANSTKIEVNVLNRPICQILIRDNYYVFIIGEIFESVDYAYVIRKEDVKNIKIVENDIHISKTILNKIDIQYLEESNTWDYTLEEQPDILDLESKDDDELDMICNSYSINILKVKTKKTKIKRITVFYDTNMSTQYVFNLSDELLKKFDEMLNTKEDKKIVDTMDTNITNTSYLKDTSDNMINVDILNMRVYKKNTKLGRLISCGDLYKDVPVRYGADNYLVMISLEYHKSKYIICLFSGYIIKHDEYLKNMDNEIKYRLYTVDKSNTMYSKSEIGLSFKSGNIPYILGESINVNNTEHIRDLHQIDDNVYPVYENGILMDYNVSWDNDNWGINYIINVKPLHSDINHRQCFILQSKHLNGETLLMNNSNECVLLRVNKENSYFTINDIHYIIATKISYNEDTWFVCNFTGLSIKEDDYDMSEDNIINSKLYFLEECDLFIDEFGISFSDDGKNFIITKQVKITKRLCIIEAYDEKATATYTLKKEGFLIKN